MNLSFNYSLIKKQKRKGVRKLQNIYKNWSKIKQIEQFF